MAYNYTPSIVPRPGGGEDVVIFEHRGSPMVWKAVKDVSQMPKKLPVGDIPPVFDAKSYWVRTKYLKFMYGYFGTQELIRETKYCYWKPDLPFFYYYPKVEANRFPPAYTRDILLLKDLFNPKWWTWEKFSWIRQSSFDQNEVAKTRYHLWAGRPWSVLVRSSYFLHRRTILRNYTGAVGWAPLFWPWAYYAAHRWRMGDDVWIPADKRGWRPSFMNSELKIP